MKCGDRQKRGRDGDDGDICMAGHIAEIAI